jgi:hypothetical protein
MGGTRGARLGSIASSCIATLKSKDQLPPIHETRSAEGVQDLGPQYCRNDPGPSIQRDVARLGSIATSRIATLKNKDQPPPSCETRSAESAQELGPQYCRDDQDRPSRGVRGTRLGSIASSRIATLKNKDQPPPSRETRSAEGVQELGPQSAEMIQAVRSRRGTWHAIRLYRQLRLS